MNTKKVLWINPSFLDYRIPLYSKLNKKLKGHFHLLYSKERIPERCHHRIIKELNENAHFIENEKRFYIGKQSDFSNKGLSIPFPKGLYSQIKNVNPEVIISEGFFQFTPWAILYSLIHHVPIIIAYEKTKHTERNCPFWRTIYRKIIVSLSKGFLANGTLTEEYLLGIGAKPNQIYKGCMCADSFELSKKAQKLEAADIHTLKSKILRRPLNEGLTFLFVGRIIELKGINHLLSAWSTYITRNFHDNLIIVGDGPLLNEYKLEYQHIKGIHFIGSIDYSDIYKYYSISDVFIIPTLEDNWSLVVPEAMACGLPIACSIYNGCYPELVKHDINGTTFDPLEESTIINALDYFHHQDLKLMGMQSIRIEEDYNPERVSERIIRAIHDISS